MTTEFNRGNCIALIRQFIANTRAGCDALEQDLDRDSVKAEFAPDMMGKMEFLSHVRHIQDGMESPGKILLIRAVKLTGLTIDEVYAFMKENNL